MTSEKRSTIPTATHWSDDFDTYEEWVKHEKEDDRKNDDR